MKSKTIVYPDRTEYHVDGVPHREDNPAIEWFDGSKEWWINGSLHREDGPAVIWSNGINFWYINHQQHRVDGPAVEYASGGGDWYINNKYLTEEINHWFSETGFNRNYTTWTPQEKLLFKLRWY